MLPVSTGHLDKCLCRAWIKIDLTEAQAEAFQRVCSGLQQAQAQTRDGRHCNSPELALQWLLERIEEQVDIRQTECESQPGRLVQCPPTPAKD